MQVFGAESGAALCGLPSAPLLETAHHAFAKLLHVRGLIAAPMIQEYDFFMAKDLRKIPQDETLLLRRC